MIAVDLGGEGFVGSLLHGDSGLSEGFGEPKANIYGEKPENS